MNLDIRSYETLREARVWADRERGIIQSAPYMVGLPIVWSSTKEMCTKSYPGHIRELNGGIWSEILQGHKAEACDWRRRGRYM